jgi:hypothetical protein
MKPPRLDKLTKNVGLVLISSSLILGGCDHRCDDRPPGQQAVPGQPPADCHGGGGVRHGGHGYVVGHGVIVMHSTGGGGAPAPAVGSARGGFGATGHAMSGGG